MFTHDLFKLSIWLEVEIPVPTPEISMSEDNPQPAPGTMSGKDGPTQTSEVNPGILIGHIEPHQEPKGEIVVVVNPSNPDADGWNTISEYLRLGTIPVDETKTWHLAHRGKWYLIHNDGLYHHSTTGALQQ
jgi:hypothetical protein